MTFLALDTPSVSFEPQQGKTSSPVALFSGARNVALPRFNLRKRTVSGERGNTALTTVNSAFLSGLFADVANVQEKPLPKDPQDSSAQDADPRLDQTQPFKKSRLSMTRSISRCGRSFKILSEALSPTGAMDIHDILDAALDTTSTPMQREDSLHYQLSCVSSDSRKAANTKAVVDAGMLAFPQLPATVSNSSCSTNLTRNLSDLQTSLSENTNKESYGWFVEMEDEDEAVAPAVDPYASKSSSDLAFQAPTAPKASNYDDELEWAKAADTVDDVLGDFF